MDHATALDRHPAVVHSKIIRNFAVVGHLEYGDVRLFANLERPDLLLAPQRAGGIDGRGALRAKESPAALRRSAKAAPHAFAEPAPIAGPLAARAWTLPP